MPEKNILIADDEPSIRNMILKLLKDEDYRLFEASDGKEAVEVVQNRSIDLAILDMVMPKMDGLEALKQIKAFDNTIEVLVITGHAELDSLREIIFDCGAFDYLLKPFDVVELKVTVRRALRDRALVKQSNMLREELENRIVDLEREFKETTFKLRESQIKYRNIVENSTDAIVITQGNYIKFANKKAITLTGYSREEMLNIQFIEMLHPDDRAAVFEKYLKRVRGEDVSAMTTFRVIRKDGSFFWVENHAANTFWGEDPAVFNDIRDISERMKAEESLRIQEAAMATAISGIGFADLDGKMTYANRAFVKMWGYDGVDEIIGIPIQRFVKNKADTARAITALQRSEGFVDQLSAVRKDGSVFDVLVFASMVKNESDMPACMMGSFLDITQQKKAEELMLRAEKLSSLGKLSAGLAHELRNPLAVVSSCSQFCLENMKLERLVRENFQAIYRNSQRASKLIGELLVFARPDQLQKSELDINELLLTILHMTGLQVDPSRVTFIRRLKKGLPKAFGDGEKLKQVFLNLIQNAIQAISGRGKIILESGFLKTDNMVEISVIDDGPGIPEDYRDKVFDPFFTTKDGGTGLGLSICHSIVEQHHGTIHMEQGDENGLRISVRLPAVRQRKDDDVS